MTMFGKYPQISARAIQAMRAVNLMSDGGTYTETCEASENFNIPQRFVRCAGLLDRKLGLTRVDLEEIAKEIREATGDSDKMVMVSWHDKYGDYLRIRVESNAYAFLCYMKS